MAKVLGSSAAQPVALESGWELSRHGPDGPWVKARVPGTAAQSLAAAGQFDVEKPEPLDRHDIWYRLKLERVPPGDAVLRFDGLATIAEVFLDGEPVLQSDNMFLSHRVPVPGLKAGSVLSLHFKALEPWCEAKKGRARWRPVSVKPAALRWARATQLGRSPSWCPSVQAVGPWRGVFLEINARPVERADVRAILDEDVGVVTARLKVKADSATLRVGEHRLALKREGDGFSGVLRIPEVQKWWPHTHGTPFLYPVSVELDGGAETLDFGKTGFRRVFADTRGNGFSLTVNHEAVFARGACWLTADLLSLGPGPLGYRHWLTLARDAGFNLIRVPGQSVYEADDFYAACDELGLLVWQDFMFAVFDYPVADAAFAESCKAEARQFVDRVQLNPSVVVFCGGSEASQQAAMLGLPRETWSSVLFDQWLPEAVKATKPDAPYVVNSPSQGALPFVADTGVAHYYGVGAYKRPLEDARRSGVRFASECLGFANVPYDAPPPGNARWEARTPRDGNASWTFADVRDHYLSLLYRVNVAELRAHEPQRYLQLAREVTGEVMAETFAEWRRAASGCRGGVVWTFQDPQDSDGWGVIDAKGRPKPVLHHLRRAFAPRAVFLLDEGVNGLSVHVHNELPSAFEGKLKLSCLRHGKIEVAHGEKVLDVRAHTALELSAFELLGQFFDVSRAYRFGPPSHEVTVATLFDAEGNVLSEAFHFPEGRFSRPSGATVNVKAECSKDAQGWSVVLEADAFVASVQLSDAAFTAHDGGFHLVPGRKKTVRLTAEKPGAVPDGEVTAVTLLHPVRFRGERG